MIDPLGGIFAFLGLLVKEKVDLWSTKPTQPDPKPIYPEPHRNSSTGISKIFIENSELYDEDVNKYGAWEAQQWVKQGKYNLNEKELEFANLWVKKKFLRLDKDKNKIEEIDKILADGKWDCHNTEAAKQWQYVHDLNNAT